MSAAEERWAALNAQLEPATRDLGDNKTRPLFSIAISLKRIADALSDPAGDDRGDVLHWLQCIARTADAITEIRK